MTENQHDIAFGAWVVKHNWQTVIRQRDEE
jgi:coenzyme F420-reducing hydrogenase beta subunit